MRHSVLLATADKRTGKILAQLIRASQCDTQSLQCLDELATVAAGKTYSLLIVDSGFLDQVGPEGTATLLGTTKDRSTKVLVLSEGDLNVKIPYLFRQHGVTNLVAKNTPIDLLDALITTNKLIRREIFGIQKYLPWGMHIVERTLHSSLRKKSLLSELEGFAAHIGCDPRLARAFVTVADEFITNAIFNGPAAEDGTPLYRHLPRTEEVELEAGQEVTLKYACDGQKLVLSVTDRFGTLATETLVDYLERWFEQEEHAVSESSGGAGLGLLFIFKFLSTIVVNIVPGECTEFIGFIDISGTYRDFVTRNKSFHIFTVAPAPR